VARALGGVTEEVQALRGRLAALEAELAAAREPVRAQRGGLGS
jgi:uncharacterized membrane protein